MGKRPSLQVYPGDWLRDNIAGCSLAAQGLWWRMMMIGHDSERYGYLAQNGVAIPSESIARRCGCTPEQYTTLLAELDAAGVPSRTPDGIVFSRRMVRDEQERTLGKLRVQKHRNGDVTPVKRSCTKYEEEEEALEVELKVLGSFEESIYGDYPRKEGRSAALKAITKAIHRYMKTANLAEVDAANFIHQAVCEFRDSPAGKTPDDGKDFRPHPTTWFNQDRYLDDRSNWYREKTTQAVTSKTEKRSTHNIETYKRTLARIKSREDAKETGDSGGGDAGGDAE